MRSTVLWNTRYRKFVIASALDSEDMQLKTKANILMNQHGASGYIYLQDRVERFRSKSSSCFLMLPNDENILINLFAKVYNLDIDIYKEEYASPLCLASIFSYDRTSKTRQLLCFQGREDRLQMLYLSRVLFSSNRKGAIAPIRPNDTQWTL